LIDYLPFTATGNHFANVTIRILTMMAALTDEYGLGIPIVLMNLVTSITFLR
jgi:hypothetical protein